MKWNSDDMLVTVFVQLSYKFPIHSSLAKGLRFPDCNFPNPAGAKFGEIYMFKSA